MSRTRGRGRLRAALVLLSHQARVLLLVAVFVDVALVGANLVFHTVDEPDREPVHPIWSDLRWNGDNDGSWMEHAGQVQVVIAAAGLVMLARRTRERLYAVLAGLLVWIVIDDAAQVHERGGELAVDLGVDPVLGIPPQQLGELAVWATAGIVLLTALALSFPPAPPLARADGITLLALFGLLLAFAVGIDTLRPVLYDVASSWLETGLSLAESAGELGTLTLMLAAVLFMVNGRPRPADTMSAGAGGTMSARVTD